MAYGGARRPYKGTSSMRQSRMARIAATGAKAAMKVVGKNRGFLRTGGYYGRYRGRKTGKNAGELKFLDTARTTNPLVVTGTVDTNLVVIPTGAGESDRIGRQVTVKSIYMRHTIVLAPTANGVDKVRCIVVNDTQANGAVFAVTDVLASASMESHYNLANQQRFRILADMNFTLNSQAYNGSTETPLYRDIKRYIKCNIPIEYNNVAATTGAIGTQRSNSIAILWINAATNQSDVTGITRVRYSDTG